MSYNKPYYNRYTQYGVDAAGYPVGYPQETAGSTLTGRDKGWKFVQFVGGVSPQIAELNEVQSIIQDQLKDLGDQIKRNGQTIGLQIRIDNSSTPKLVRIEKSDPLVAGKVYINGLFHIVPESNLTISGAGAETIAVRINKQIITATEDPALYDLSTGTYNSGKEGAYRHVYEAQLVVKTDQNKNQLTDAYDIWVLQDGQLKSSSNDILTSIDRNLIQYTSDISGDCLVRGMRVRVQDASATNFNITVDRGVAIVSGKRIEYGTTTVLNANKSKGLLSDYKTTLTEFIPTTSKLTGSNPIFENVYKTANTPISQISKLSMQTVIRKQGTYFGSAPFSQDINDPLTIIIPNSAPYGPLVNVLSVYDVATSSFLPFTYIPGKGFSLLSLPQGQIQVTWVFTATLVSGTDYAITSTSSISTDKRSFSLTGTRPAALTSSLVSASGDEASYVFPGAASTQLTTNMSSGQTNLTLVSVEGLVVGQKLYIGSTRDITQDETIVIQSISSSSKTITIIDPLINSYTFTDTHVYVNPVFIGLPLTNTSQAITIDYSYMLDRVDVLYLDSNGVFSIQTGQANVPAYPASLPKEVLPLVQLKIPANGNAADVIVSPYPIQRQDQQGLNKILGRLDQLEYNLAQQNLQLNTYNKAAATGLQLRSIITDAFVNSNTVDITALPSAIKNIMIDPDSGELSPMLMLDSSLLSPDTVNSTVAIKANSITIDYTLSGSSLVTNILETDVETIRSDSNIPKPTINVTTGHYIGSADRSTTWPFFNTAKNTTELVSKDLEGGFWKTRQNNVPWLNQQQLFLPASTLLLSGRNFSAGAYTVKIDGKAIANSSVTVTASGLFNNLAVQVPAQTVSGHASRTVTVVDSSGNTIASTLYGATPSEVQFLPITTNSLAANSFVPVAQTFVYPADKFIGGVNLKFAAKSTGWVEVQIRTTQADGSPSGTILTAKRLLSSEVSITGVTTVTFDDPVFCPANTVLALCFVTEEPTSANMYQLKKAVVGRTDATSNNIVSTKPIAQGALYTSIDGGGFTIQTNSVLTFTLLECIFSSTRNTLQFQPVTSSALSQICSVLPRIHQLMPIGTKITWSCILDEDVLNPIALVIDTDGTLNPQVLPKAASKLTLIAKLGAAPGLNTVSPHLNSTNARLLMFEPKTQALYLTRAVSSVPEYTKARVTLQLLAGLQPSTAVKVKFTPYDDPYGVAKILLSGVPAFNDQLTIVAQTVPFTFTYQPTGTPSLQQFAIQFTSAFNSAGLGVSCEYTQETSGNYFLKFRNLSGKALVSGDLIRSFLIFNASTLDCGPVLTNYQTMVLNTVSSQVINTQFTEYTFELSGIDSTPPTLSTPRTFRVQVELTTTNPLKHPVIRNLACVVSI